MSYHRMLPLALACAFATPSHAQALPAQDDATDLDEIVVTATRTEVALADSLVAAEVIDREEILRSQARSLPELLRGRAGFSISNQGGAGKLTTVFLRGAESDHVLVLIDGVRIGSPTSGLVAFQDLPLALIERVEIVRGPRSSLYGSEAIGGVIQIFTRRSREGLHPRASATLGSNGHAAGSAGLGGGNGRAWFGIDAAYKHVEGIDACEVATPTQFSGGCGIAAPEPDDDGYRNRSLSLRGGFRAGDTLRFEAHALRAEGRNEYDGDFSNLSKTVQQVVGGAMHWQPSQRFGLQLRAGRNRDAANTRLHKFDPLADDGAGADVELDRGYFDTDRDSATLQGDIAVGDRQLFTVGVDWLRDRVDASTQYAETERDNRALFAQYQGRFDAGAFDAQSLQASVRHDDNQQYGDNTTGSVAWGLDFNERWRLTAGYGTAFKAPSFNELYFPFFGNPALRPEESRSWELGLRYQGARIDWRLDGYSTRVDDLITFDAALGLPANIQRARIHGVELGLDTDLADWQLGASLGYLDTENREGLNAGNALPRRARHSARIALDRAFGGFRIGATGITEGSRFDDVANTRRLGSYARLDLRAEYAVTAAWTLQARLANAFDREYETASFYNQPGREWFLTLRYAPQQ